MSSIDSLCINTIRFLAVDQVERAGSGHPGMPLGAAPMAYALWDRHLRHNPANPKWFNRDRFILSAGHASALLYSLLHLYGYDLPLDELKRFRQWGSRTPGHPEYGRTPGVECITGPLEQGFAMGVGMAMAEAHLAAMYNDGSGKHQLVDHFTYAIVSDGDLMEGVSNEAASLAGTLKLGKLVYLYDDNHITIEGDTNLAFTENTDARFEALGWQVQSVADGNDVEAIDAAITAAKAETSRPSLIRVHTHIGFGSPRQDTAKAHGEPLGIEDARTTKESFEWPVEPSFYVPDAAREHCARAVEKGANLETAWNATRDAWAARNADRRTMFHLVMTGELPAEWDSRVPTFDPTDGPIATRSASGKVIAALAAHVPGLIGGSADLAGSNKSVIPGGGDFTTDGPAGRNIHFGVREHAMGATVNGMALHGGVLPYGATFLVFSDYMRPAIRLAALMHVHSTFVFTYDSIGLGEDGPTHQPVEHIMSLRAIPGLRVLRPADANETAAVWRLAVEYDGPSALALSRQNLPVLGNVDVVVGGTRRGAYVVSDATTATPAAVLVATGSEVHLAIEAQKALSARGMDVRVVSMPCAEIWTAQDTTYRDGVLPRGIPRVVVEAGRSMGWRDLVGDPCEVVGLDRFGASAPANEVFEHLGFRVSDVVARVVEIVARVTAAR